MKKPVVTFVLEIFMSKDYSFKTIFPASEYGGEEPAYLIAKSIGDEYNRDGHDFVIYKETVEAVSFVVTGGDKNEKYD